MASANVSVAPSNRYAQAQIATSKPFKTANVSPTAPTTTIASSVAAAPAFFRFSSRVLPRASSTEMPMIAATCITIVTTISGSDHAQSALHTGYMCLRGSLAWRTGPIPPGRKVPSLRRHGEKPRETTQTGKDFAPIAACPGSGFSWANDKAPCAEKIDAGQASRICSRTRAVNQDHPYPPAQIFLARSTARCRCGRLRAARPLDFLCQLGIGAVLRIEFAQAVHIAARRLPVSGRGAVVGQRGEHIVVVGMSL